MKYFSCPPPKKVEKYFHGPPFYAQNFFVAPLLPLKIFRGPPLFPPAPPGGTFWPVPKRVWISKRNVLYQILTQNYIRYISTYKIYMTANSFKFLVGKKWLNFQNLLGKKWLNFGLVTKIFTDQYFLLTFFSYRPAIFTDQYFLPTYLFL